MSKHILITGASSGIGAAIASNLASDPNHVLSLGARRVDRLSDMTDRAHTAFLDVTDEASVETFLRGAEEANGPVHTLINNAGLARGLERIADADGVAWREMMETNVMGVLHVTRRILPGMLERGEGHIVMIGSIAGYETYEGGSVYCASKRALQSITEGLRLEVLGSGVRVTSVDPGLVQTEFSLVRFRWDEEKAEKPYHNTRPLIAEDIADCVAFALSRPDHVNIDTILVKPTDQAAAQKVHRR